MNDDVNLIRDALNGDSSAFGRLVHKYQDRLFNTLVHVIGNREEAEDLVQDAFVQAFVKLESFQGQSAFLYLALPDRFQHDDIPPATPSSAKVA